MDMNKPVAYVTGVRQFDPVSVDTVLKVGTPLYTHPVKELTLTIEEIYAVWASGEYYTVDKDGSIDEFRFADFADAILRKVQEQ